MTGKHLPPSRNALSTMAYLFLQLVLEDPVEITKIDYTDDLRVNLIEELETLFFSLDDHPDEAERFIRDLNAELDGGSYRTGDTFEGWFYTNLTDSVKYLANEDMAEKIIKSFGWMEVL